MDRAIDTIVIGAGVVGLAVARALALDGREVVVLEKNGATGEETSSRNSEVIHAGIYYPPGSLKAELCVRGRDLLYRYCKAKGIPYRRCGKVIVAVTEAQQAELELLRLTAAANGVEDLSWLDRGALDQLEPSVLGTAGLLSPSTGIVDSHALMLALQGDLEEAGGLVALKSELIGGQADGDRVRLQVEAGDERIEIAAHRLVNAAGLHADRVARSLEGFLEIETPPLRYAKGNYFLYQGRSPFRHLVYPLPEPGGLGVHATLDLAGRTRFGPDVEWSDTIDYTLDPARASRFYAAIRRYWPALPEGSLVPGYVGVRPKLNGPTEPPADFMIAMTGQPPGPAAVHLLGIESPGLTAALAIGEQISARLSEAH